VARDEVALKATSRSWKTERFPANRGRLKLDRSFDPVEWDALLCGVIPEEMEDKWFIYEEGGWLNFHRSWTGFCNYRVRLRKTPNGGEIAEAWVSRQKDQYTGIDKEEEASEKDGDTHAPDVDDGFSGSPHSATPMRVRFRAGNARRDP